MANNPQRRARLEVPLEDRPQLVARIDAAIDSGLLVLAGPIGSGVSTIIRQLSARAAADDETILHTGAVGLDIAVEKALASSGPVTLLIDHVQNCGVDDLRNAIVRFGREPKRTRLVLGGDDQTVGRLAGAIAGQGDNILRAAELWFDREAIARYGELLCGRRPGAEAIDAADDLTRGWPAALALTAAETGWPLQPLIIDRNRFGLPTCPAPLRERIIARLHFEERPDLLDLLGRLAPFPWLDGERIAAVVDAPGPGALETLRGSGLPPDPRPGDEPPGAWRAHPLLLSVADRHLHERDPEGRADVLERAAGRLALEGDVAGALGCLHELNDGRALARFNVEHFLDLAHTGQVGRLLEILQQVPREDLLDVPFGVLNYGLLHRFVGDERGAHNVWSGLYSDRIDGGQPLYEASAAVGVLVAVGIGFGREPEEVIGACDSVLERFGIAHDGTMLDNGFVGLERMEDLWGLPWHLDPTTVLAFLCGSRAEAEMRLGRPEDGRPWVERGRRLANRDPRTIAVLDAVEAALDCRAGELRRAEMLADAALDGLGGLAPFAPTIDPRITLAEIMLRRGDTDAAGRWLVEPEKDARTIGAVNRVGQILAIHAGIALATSRYRRGIGLLDGSREARDVRLAPDLRRRLRSIEALLHLRLGDPEPARRLLHATDDPRIRAALAVAAGDEGKLRLTIDLWPHSEQIADRACWIAVKAHRHRLAGDHESARTALHELSALITPEGYLQPILDLGIDLHDLVTVIGRRSDESEFEELARRLEFNDGVGGGVHLSPRELQVLEGVAGHIPDDELSELLGITPNTLKTFHRRIFRKLKVSSRGEAVRRAEEIGLLAPRPSRLPSRRLPS